MTTPTPRHDPTALGTDRIAHANWFLSTWHYGTAASPVLLTCALVLAIGFLFVVVKLLNLPATMSVIVTPAPSSLQRTGEIRPIPIEAIQDWARRAVMEFETCDNATATDAAERSAEYVHTAYRPKFRAEMADRKKQFEQLWLSRFVSPGIPVVIPKGNGRYQVLVPYEQIEYTGRTRKERAAPTSSDRVTTLDLWQDLPSDRNAEGLWLVGRAWMTRDEWKAGGYQPLWTEDGRPAATAAKSAPK